MSRHFLDTNILLYAISDAPSDVPKRRIADAILNRDDNALSVQVLQEFYHQATRRSRAGAISHDDAVALLHQFARFPVQPMTVAVMHQALAIRRAANYSYWDCAVIAAAAALGCTELLTEDLQHNQTIAGVRIVNPFL